MPIYRSETGSMTAYPLCVKGKTRSVAVEAGLKTGTWTR